MANKKISQLTSGSQVDPLDYFPMVDAASGETQAVTAAQIGTSVLLKFNTDVVSLNLNSVTASNVTTTTLGLAKLNLNSLTASNVNTTTLTIPVINLNLNSLTASNVNATTLTIPVINLNLNTLTSSVVTTTTLNLAQLNLNSLTASNVTTTTLTANTSLNSPQTLSTRGDFSSLTGSFLSGTQATIQNITASLGLAVLGKVNVSNSITASVIQLVNFSELTEVTAPGSPSSGFGRTYAKSDGHIYYKNSAGIEFDLALSGSNGAVSGLGSINTIAIWDGPSSITFNNNLTWDGIKLGSNQIAGNSLTASALTSSNITSRFITASNGLLSNGNSYLNGNTYVTGNVQISGTIQGYSSEYLNLTGNYVLTTADNAKIITINSEISSTLTAPLALQIGYSVSIIQLGSGSIFVTNSVGGSIFNRDSHKRTSGKYAMASLINLSGNAFLFVGDTIP